MGDMQWNDSYQAVGNAGDVKNVNPMTDNSFNFLQGLASGQGLSGLMSQFQGMTPALQNISSSLTSGYAGNRLGLAELMANEARRQTSAEFANMGVGAVNSGAFVDAMTRASMLPYMQATTDIAGMGTQLSGNMMNNLFGLTGQGVQGMTAYGAPEWWQPTYVEKKGLLGQAGDFFTGLAPTLLPLLFGQGNKGGGA